MTRLFSLIILILTVNHSFAMLHEPPTTDGDMIELAKSYPAVGIISQKIFNIETDQFVYANSTGTLINLPQCQNLRGKLVLGALHTFHEWEAHPHDFTFTLEEGLDATEQDEASHLKKIKIIDIIAAPALQMRPWYGLGVYSYIVPRDIAIAVLETAITHVQPMDLWFDPLPLKGKEVLTAAGYGFNGRVDLGILLLNDKRKRAIQFPVEELEAGRSYWNNPTVNQQPLYYHRPNQLTRAQGGLIRGCTQKGDSGGPLIINIDGKNRVLGLIHGGNVKTLEIQPQYIEMVKINLLLMQHDSGSIECGNLFEELEILLKGNDSTVPPHLESFANRAYQHNIISEQYEFLGGAKDWLQNVTYNIPH